MNKDILLVIETVSNEKNVKKDIVIEAIEEALKIAVKKKHRLENKSSYDIDVRVSIDRESGEHDSFRRWKVVNEIESDEFVDQQILLQDAIAKNPDIKLDDYYEEEIRSADFGRIVAQTAKNVIVQKIREAERNRIVEIYKPKIGQLIFGVVKRVDKGTIFIDLGVPSEQSFTEEAMIGKNALIPREVIRPGDRIRGYLQDVQSETRGPQLYISRILS